MTRAVSPSPLARVPDADLLAAAAGGDRVALGTLVRRYVDFVYAAAARQTDAHTAGDVTQAVFLVLARKAGRVRAAALPAWLHRTTRYVAANAARAARRRRRHERAAARPERVMPDAEPDPLLPLLDDAIASLGGDDRRAIIERYLRGQDVAAVAATLGVSPAAAQKRLERAVGRLRKQFVNRGAPAATVALAAALASAGPSSANAAPAALVISLQSAATGLVPASVTVKGILAMTYWTPIKIAAGVVVATGLLAAAGVEIVGVLAAPVAAPGAQAAAVTAPTAGPGGPSNDIAPPPVFAKGTLRGTLNNGIGVDLIGLTASPAHGQAWWRPDGTPMASAPYDHFGATIDLGTPANLLREFAYRTSLPPQLADADISISTSAAGSFGRGNVLDVSGREVPNLVGVVADLADRPATLRFWVAARPWKVMFSHEPHNADDGAVDISPRGRVLVTPSPDVDGTPARTVIVTGEMLHDNAAWRLIGVDADGTERRGRPASARATKDQRSTTVTFDGARTAPVGYRYETRPYDQWIEFSNVALHADQALRSLVATSDDPVARPPAPGEYAKLAPFTALRWSGDTAEVRVDGVWYAWLGLDGRSMADLVADARRIDPKLWQKRIGEDLVEMCDKAGHPVGGAVTLDLRPLDGKAVVTRPGVPMTAENRRAVYEHRTG